VLFYVVHGLLHVVGFDEIPPADANQMKAAERRHLAKFGLVPPGR
jgi:ssRNA-specific RNase YbeY (16S rRNA maturation enzyme)